MIPISLFPYESSALATGKLGVLIRVVEPQPPAEANVMVRCDRGGPIRWWAGKETHYPDRGIIHDQKSISNVAMSRSWTSPFGPSGTTLECREAGWMDKELVDFPSHGMPPHLRFFFHDRTVIHEHDGSIGTSPFTVTDEIVKVSGQQKVAANDMPSWAVRFHPVVGEVRCVRVQEVTEEDAKAWGVRGVRLGFVDPRAGGRASRISYIEGFGDMFESIHGPGSWEVNPWIWIAAINTQTGESK